MNIYLFFLKWLIIIFIIIIILNNKLSSLYSDIFDNDLHINKLLKFEESDFKNNNVRENKIWISNMIKDGAIVIPDILSNSDCDSLLEIISTEKKKTFFFC